MKKFKLFILFSVLFVISNDLTSQTHWYLRTGAGAPTNLTSWTDAPAGVGGTSPVAGEFAQTNRIWHFRNRTTATINSNWNINASSTASVESGINLTVTNNGPLGGVINGLIDITSGGTVTVQNAKNYKWNNLDLSSSTVIFDFTGAFIKGTTNQYGSIIVNKNANLDASTTDIYVNGLLTINTGTVLSFNGYGLYLYGTNGMLAGGGSFSSDINGYIVFLGGNGGNSGTLNFSTSTGTVNGLYFGMASSSEYITLGSNVVIENNGVFQQLGGSVDLNGKSLVINSGCDISFPAVSSDGDFRGTSTSGIFINGTVGMNVPNGIDIFMNPSNNILGSLSLDGSSAIMNAGNALNIADSLSILNGADFTTNNNLTLVSTNTLKGRLSRIDPTTSNLNGNLTVQTFARGSITDWANLGISGVSSQSFTAWYGQIPMAIEGSTTGVTSVSNTYFESVQSWFESSDTYDTTLTVTSPIIPGKGYWVYLGTGLFTTADMVWSVAGAPVMGDINIPITNSGAGWNLISNPYPSPISWDNVMSVVGNNALVNDAYYIYDAEMPGGTVSYVGGVATPLSYQTMTNVIPMGQAFYVEAIGAGNLTIQEDCKSNKNTNANELLKSNSSAISSVFRLNIDGGGYHDDAVIRFHSNATSSFDKSLDARKIYNSPGYVGYPGAWSKRTVIATQSNNEDYSINSLPYAQTQNAVIPVIARVYTTGQYTISGTDIQNLPPNACVILKDKLLNTTQDLRLGSYICNIVDTTIASRFELTVCADITADVKSQTAVEAVSSIVINKDAQGIFVDFDFKNTTKANITVTNILGQKIMDTKKVKVTNDNVYLDINVNDQLIFVTVETENEKVTKKFLNFR